MFDPQVRCSPVEARLGDLTTGRQPYGAADVLREAERILIDAGLPAAADGTGWHTDHPDDNHPDDEHPDDEDAVDEQVGDLQVGDLQIGDLQRALARTGAVLRAAEVDRDEAVAALAVARDRLAAARQAADTARAGARAAGHERDLARAETARLVGERSLADAAAAAAGGAAASDPAALGSGLVAGLDAAPGPGLAATVRALVGDLGVGAGSGPGVDLGCLEGLADDQLVTLVEAGRRLAAWAGAVQVHAAGALGDRWAAGPLSGSDDALGITACEIALATGLTRYAAADLVETARHLPAGMPGLWAAFTAGGVDLATAVQVWEKTGHLAPAAAAAVEAGLLAALAKEVRPTRPQLVTLLDRLVALADPAGAEDAAAECRARRGVRFRALAHGMGQLNLTAGAEDIEAARAALNALTLTARHTTHHAEQAARSEDPDGDPASEPARRERGRLDDPDNPHAPCDPDGRHPAATRADVLLDLITGTTDTADPSDPDPSGSTDPATPDTGSSTTDAPGPSTTDPATTGSGGVWPRRRPGSRRRREIVVLVPLSVLTGHSEQPATLAGYGPIPAQLARELAATSTWRCAATDDRDNKSGTASPTHGTLLGLGRSTYTPAYTPGPGLRRFIEIRDGTCQFPGCRHPATRSDLDHRNPWTDPTADATDATMNATTATCDCNLHALCRHHHRLKHSGRIHTRPATGGGTTWTTPTAHTYTRRPDPLT